MNNAPDDYRASLELFAGFYENMGRYEEAEKMHDEVLLHIDKNNGKHTFYARKLIESAGNDYIGNQNAKATAKLEEALQILEEEVSPGHWAILSAHNLLGLIAQDEGQLDEAEKQFNFCIEQRLLAKFDKSYDHAISLHNKASLYVEKGKLAEAEKLQQESAAIMKSLNTKLTLDMQANLQDNVATLYQVWGKYDLAEKNWLEVLQKFTQYIHENFAFMSDYEKAKFWQRNKKDFEAFNTFALLRKTQKRKSLVRCMTISWLPRGFYYPLPIKSGNVFTKAATARRSISITTGSQNRERLAREYAEATSDKKTPHIDSLERKVNLIEKELSLSAEDLRADKPTTWRDVQKTLGPDEAAIEVVRFHYFNSHRTDSVVYAVMVLTAENKIISAGSRAEGWRVHGKEGLPVLS